MGYIDKPQRLWWRKILFQVHLWVGVILGLYIIVIGLTGSILVFRDELALLSHPDLNFENSADPAGWPDLTKVMKNAQAEYPEYKLVSAYMPTAVTKGFLVYMEGANERWLYLIANPADGRIAGSMDLKTSWLFWMSDLHIRLLAGNVGWILNGLGGAFLVLLTVTGLVLWWPGIKTWRRALTINWKRSWKRINFDLHSAIGFWTLSIVSMWALSGVYFVFPKQFEAVVNYVSPVAGGVEPQVKLPPPVIGQSADMQSLLAQAQAASPASRLAGIYIPENAKGPITVFMARKALMDFSQMDRVYFDPSSGKQLAIWRSGINPTLGSKFVYWLGPLHFGVYWGTGIKILWAALGLSLPVLTITGTLMYWNRSLSKYWAKLKSRSHLRALREELPEEVTR